MGTAEIGKGKTCCQAKWLIRPERIPVSICSIKPLGVFLIPPAQGYPPAVNMLVPIYTPGWRGALWK